MSSIFKQKLRKSPPFEVRKSKIHGRGVFATRKIPWGTRIIQYTGEKIGKKEADRREKTQDKKGVNYIFCLNSTYDIDGAVGGNESKYINHSCTPNCAALRENGEIWMFSIHNIKNGEELGYDYEFDDRDTPCHCGSKRCRGYI